MKAITLAIILAILPIGVIITATTVALQASTKFLLIQSAIGFTFGLAFTVARWVASVQPGRRKLRPSPRAGK